MAFSRCIPPLCGERAIARRSTVLELAASMPGGVLGCGIVEHDQRIDGDAGFGIDQERIDVDRGDAGADQSHGRCRVFQ